MILTKSWIHENDLNYDVLRQLKATSCPAVLENEVGIRQCRPINADLSTSQTQVGKFLPTLIQPK